MKRNRKLKIIIAVCFIFAILVNYMMYNIIKLKADPEPEVSILVFKELEADTELTETNFRYMKVKESQVPKGIIKNIDDLIGKRLTINVHDGEFIYPDKISERGVYKIDTNNMYIIGIDVYDISDSLGIQLKIGDSYKVYSKFENQEPMVIADAVIVNLVDTNGKEVNSEVVTAIKTLNVAVKTEEEIKSIIIAESSNAIELVKFPESK